jgi:hypothetical protein
MSLRKSPVLTPRALAARRANALKSTGPRTPQGKARVRFNGLRFGGHSARMASYYYRRHGWDPRDMLALFRACSAPGEEINPLQKAFVGSWLVGECGPHSLEVERFKRLLIEQEERYWDAQAAQIYRMLWLSRRKADQLPSRMRRSPVGRRLKILDRLEAWRLFAGGQEHPRQREEPGNP